jgi:hypothetical protein
MSRLKREAWEAVSSYLDEALAVPEPERSAPHGWRRYAIVVRASRPISNSCSKNTACFARSAFSKTRLATTRRRPASVADRTDCCV